MNNHYLYYTVAITKAFKKIALLLLDGLTTATETIRMKHRS